jgi:hypothetical protein
MTVANPNAPFGLRPVRHFAGGIVRLSEGYTVADQYGTSLFIGDPVLVTGTGCNLGIAAAGNGDKISGVFAGCEYQNSLGDTIWSKYWPASTATYNAQGAKAIIYDDPWIVYEVMFATVATTDIRNLANLVAGNGNAQTGLSGWTAAAPAGGANQLKVLRLPTSEVNPGGIANNYGAYGVAQVLLAQHELLSGTMTGI